MNRSTISIFFICILVLGACSSPPTPIHTTSLLAFPDCKGFGCNTLGGKGGIVLVVTNLNDSGVGSLRAALSATYPRIVVFNVSGTIQLTSHLIIDNPYITIAGQTSPNGVQIKGAGIKIRTHDVIIRGMMMRPGNESTGAPLDDRSGILIQNDRDSTQPYNIVIDHNSLEWAVDENANIWNPQGSHDITFSNNIIAEGLHCAGHSNGCHSMGLAIAYASKNITVYGNLFASNDWRNPIMGSDTSVEIINNVIYNWGGGGIIMQGTGQGPNYLNVLGNFTKATSCAVNKGVFIDSYDAGSKLYTDENLTSSVIVYSPAFPLSGISVMTKDAAYAYVMSSAGARNDGIDSRIKATVNNGTLPNGKCTINSTSEVGGWAVISAGTYSDMDENGLPDGTSNVDDWINSFYTSVIPSAMPITIVSTHAAVAIL